MIHGGRKREIAVGKTMTFGEQHLAALEVEAEDLMRRRT